MDEIYDLFPNDLHLMGILSMSLISSTQLLAHLVVKLDIKSSVHGDELVGPLKHAEQHADVRICLSNNIYLNNLKSIYCNIYYCLSNNIYVWYYTDQINSSRSS